MEQVGGAERRAQQAFRAGHIQIRLVDRSHLDQRREAIQHFKDAAGVFTIALRVAFDENGLRTVLVGGAQRHGGMHAEFARFVRGGGDDAPLITFATHHNRLAAQIRIVEFFHRHEERVHIDVKDGAAHGFSQAITRGIPARSGNS